MNEQMLVVVVIIRHAAAARKTERKVILCRLRLLQGEDEAWCLVASRRRFHVDSERRSETLIFYKL